MAVNIRKNTVLRPAALAVSAFLLFGVGSIETQQSEDYVDYVLAHSVDLTAGSEANFVSRIGIKDNDPNTPEDESLLHEYKGGLEFPFGNFFDDLSPYPGSLNPNWILGAVRKGSGPPNESQVVRLRTDGSAVDSAVATIGAVSGAFVVSGTPLRDHYFVTLDMNNQISSGGLEFVSPNADSIIEHFENGVLNHNFTWGAAFNWFNNFTPNIETDDIFTWWVPDTDRIGWTEDSIWRLRLTYDQALTSLPDPFGNPNPSLGPPFPQVPTMLDIAPQGIWTRLYLFNTGNDDDLMDLDHWVDVGNTTVTGRNGVPPQFIIGANTHFHPPASWGTHLWGFDADINPTSKPDQQADIGGAQAASPTFHTLKVFGNYCFVSTGIHLNWPGGVQVLAYRLSSSGGSATAAVNLNFTASGTFNIPNGSDALDGMAASMDGRHLFVGADQSNNIVWRLNAAAGTINANGIGFMTAANPCFEQSGGQTVYQTISMTTEAEDLMQPPNYPPNRVWPFYAGTSYRIVTNAVLSFDGNNNKSPGESLGCAGSAAAASAGLLAGVALFAGLVSALTRK